MDIFNIKILSGRLVTNEKMNQIHRKNSNLNTEENAWSPHDEGQPVLGDPLAVAVKEADEGRGANCQW